MRYPQIVLTTAALVVFPLGGLGQVVTPGRTSAGAVQLPSPSLRAAQTTVVFVGEVTEVERETVDVPAYRGADYTVKYKVAVVKIDEPIIGGKGLTKIRVGFPAAAPAALPPVPGYFVTSLARGQEGCFFLNPSSDGDFYVFASGGAMDKKDKNFAKSLDEVKKAAKILDDPVTALKSKGLDDRFQAALVLLERYRTNRTGKPANREPVPEEENKLILSLLGELPWQAKDTKPRPAEGGPAPNRSDLWYMVLSDLTGFRPPTIPRGASLTDRATAWDEATSAYLKDNIDKIKLKRVAK
jgi:hypothetical protein